jgi:hypothetical protein
MHTSGSKMGISEAIERFSYLAVPVGNTPSMGRAETGRRSPSPASRAAVTRRTNSGASAGIGLWRDVVDVTVDGNSTRSSAASEASIAAKLRSTIERPRLP